MNNFYSREVEEFLSDIESILLNGGDQSKLNQDQVNLNSG